MSKPEFKSFPCIFCTIGFNSYVAVNKLLHAASKKIKKGHEQNTLDIEDNVKP